MSEYEEGLRQLRKYEYKLKVQDMDETKRAVEDIVDNIVDGISAQDEQFALREEKRGSVYEKLKIDEPDEFDFDLPLVELARDTLQQQWYSLPEFTLFNLENSQSQWSNYAVDGYLSSEKVFDRFHSLVEKACEQIKLKDAKVIVICNRPAVTIKCRGINIDLAPVIKINQWPERSLEDWKHRCVGKNWPHKELIEKVDKTSVLLIPKWPKDGSRAINKCLWKYAFNEAEKALLLDTWPTIQNNCRRRVLKVLKGFSTDYKWRLKSYYIKILMFYQFEKHHAFAWTDYNYLSRVLDAMKMLREKLTERKLSHYFLPAVNLFERLDFVWIDKEVIPCISAFLENPARALRQLNIVKGDSFQVFVKDLNGKTLTVDVNNEMTIYELKSEVSAKRGMAMDQLRLVHQGHYVTEGTIESTGIKSGNEIQIQARLRGGKTFHAGSLCNGST